MGRVFSHENPVLGDECMRVARHAARGIWSTGDDEVPVGLVWWRGSPWVWTGGKWKETSAKEVENALWRELEGLHVETMRDGERTLKKWQMNGAAMRDVTRALEASCALDVRKAPFQLGAEKRPLQTKFTLAFLDKVVDLESGQAWDRGPWWFDPTVVGVRLVETEEEERARLEGRDMPLWRECLRKWSCGDEEWVECYKRMLGYAVLPWRDLQRWYLMYGMVRAGKGTTTRLLKRLLGDHVVFDAQVEELTGPFGLGKLLDARVLTVPEVGTVGKLGSQLASLMKSIVGQDTVQVNRKYKDPVTFQSGALVMMQSNQLPDLPDRARGLTSKMLLIPFKGGQEGKEDTGLDERLVAEEPAIMRWILEGSRAVIREGLKGLWAPKSAAEDAEGVGMEGSQVREFVLECLETGGFTTPDELWGVWNRWKVESGHALVQLGKQNVSRRVVEEAMAMRWHVERKRTRDQRYLHGVKVKQEWQP